MAKEQEQCPHCGQKIMQYKHTMTKGLARILAQALMTVKVPDKPFHLSKAGFTYSQRSNFQHLKYWGLIEKNIQAGKHVSGEWKLTRKAFMFLCGLAIEKTVTVFDNVVRDRSDEKVRAYEVRGWFQSREEWARHAEPFKELVDNRQAELLLNT